MRKPERARLRRTWLAAAVAGVMLAAPVLGTVGASGAATDPTLVFGAYAPRVGNESEQQAVLNLEQQIGRRLGVVRDFERWNDQFPDAYHTWLRTNGYPMILSVRGMLANGTHLSWADIASAQPGTSLHNDMVRWARGVKSYGLPVLFSFNQEPELIANIPNGTSQDFIAAWRKFVSVFRAEAVTNVRFLWVMTEWSFALPASDRRAAASWYPGDAYVDGMGVDVYNWHRCRPGINNAWASLRSLIEPFRAFGAAHPGKPLWLAEWGGVEDPAVAGRKAQWIQDAQAMFKEPAYAQFEGISYFNQTYHNAQFDCAWKVDSTAGSLNAFKTMANDVFYSASYSLPGPGNSPPTARMTMDCTELVCRFDGTGSTDADGTITGYSWDFGDGSAGTGANPSHTYPRGDSYSVRLVVTDNDGATGALTSTVTTNADNPIAFVGGAVSNGNALTHTVNVPTSASAGDGLLLFDTINNTTTTEAAPSGLAGWTLVDTATANGLRTRLWQRSLGAGEAGRPVTVSVSAYSKVALQLLVYSGTRAGAPVGRSARAVETVVRTSHTTPVLPDVLAGSTVVSYWSDKTAATTAWTPPGAQIVRGQSAGTLSGRVSHLVTDAVPSVTGDRGGVAAAADSADARATMWTVVLAPD